MYNCQQIQICNYQVERDVRCRGEYHGGTLEEEVDVEEDGDAGQADEAAHHRRLQLKVWQKNI